MYRVRGDVLGGGRCIEKGELYRVWEMYRGRGDV